MMEQLEQVINGWLQCEITGDKAMSEVVQILNKEGKYKDEIHNACTKE